jgi:alpha-glucosidase
MKRKIFLSLLLVIAGLSGCSTTDKVIITSPDGTLKLEIASPSNDSDNSVALFSLTSGGREVLLPSSIGLTTDKIKSNYSFKITGTSSETTNTSWINPLGEKREIPEIYNQTTIFLEGPGLKMTLICRAYNEGVAIAYEFPEQAGLDSLVITDESIILRFREDYLAWSAARAQAKYTYVPLSKIEPGCERPLVVEFDTTLSIALGEAGLVNYARMKFEPDSSGGISIRTKLDSEVRMSIPFRSPWRYIMTGKNSGDLLEKNYFILNLNDPSAITDISWIKPGKVLREVTLTTTGAKAAIDFTSLHNMQYVEFDAGWYGPENKEESDARSVNLDPARSKGPLDMQEVIRYATDKNIGILLYVNRRALERQIDTILPIYKDWGIKGIKFGFVQVGNQKVTSWLHESIKKVASYQMVADVHDEYRPTGFSRTYPNFLTMEGIRGDEESPTNSHTLITMFTRMIAGPGDNTICYYNERVDKKMGSHASQLAKAVCIFSPLQFIYWYDKASPSLEKKDGLWGTTNYIGDEPELEFFDNVPTVWDETKVLYAKPGEYGIIARRKGEEWFIGGINGETARELVVNFSFLNHDSKYTAKIYSDDPLIDTRTHVRIDSLEIKSTDVYNASLAANNGIAFHLSPIHN